MNGSQIVIPEMLSANGFPPYLICML